LPQPAFLKTLLRPDGDVAADLADYTFPKYRFPEISLSGGFKELDNRRGTSTEFVNEMACAQALASGPERPALRELGAIGGGV
jgi:hypothetical protein